MQLTFAETTLKLLVVLRFTSDNSPKNETQPSNLPVRQNCNKYISNAALFICAFSFNSLPITVTICRANPIWRTNYINLSSICVIVTDDNPEVPMPRRFCSDRCQWVKRLRDDYLNSLFPPSDLWNNFICQFFFSKRIIPQNASFENRKKERMQRVQQVLFKLFEDGKEERQEGLPAQRQRCHVQGGAVLFATRTTASTATRLMAAESRAAQKINNKNFFLWHSHKKPQPVCAYRVPHSAGRWKASDKTNRKLRLVSWDCVHGPRPPSKEPKLLEPD